jgi:protocatechuate 3,4-dioxygenase beta subunit
MRNRLHTVGCSLITLLSLVVSSAALAQNRGDCQGRQATGWETEVASDEEPGERMIVSGTVYDSTGTRTLSGVTIFVFQTDAEGYYSDGGMDETNARLCGLMVSDAEGRYRFKTIRPAHYATGGPPAHIHYRVWGPEINRQSATLNFEGDPLLGERGRDASNRPSWATIRPVLEGDNGILLVTRDLRVRTN